MSQLSSVSGLHGGDNMLGGERLMMRAVDEGMCKVASVQKKENIFLTCTIMLVTVKNRNVIIMFHFLQRHDPLICVSKIQTINRILHLQVFVYIYIYPYMYTI